MVPDLRGQSGSAVGGQQLGPKKQLGEELNPRAKVRLARKGKDLTAYPPRPRIDFFEWIADISYHIQENLGFHWRLPTTTPNGFVRTSQTQGRAHFQRRI